MTPVDQTNTDPKLGDCLPACIATILEVPLDRVPNFCAEYSGDWFQEMQKWGLENFGFGTMIAHLVEDDGVWRWQGGWPMGLFILSGITERGTMHAVVARGAPEGIRIEFDPHPSRAGLIEHRDAIVFTYLDPGLLIHSRWRKIE